MRAGPALALLYRAEVMFLDEPTLGLDVSGATSIRRFVSEYAQQAGATVLLTSHYMADVASLCPRLVLIVRRSGCSPPSKLQATWPPPPSPVSSGPPSRRPRRSAI